MILDILSGFGRRRLVAADSMAHDIYIVEFPKSGITWLCTLIANTALISADQPHRATYFSVQHYVPDIHMAGGLPLGRSILTGIPQRLIKSHSEYNRHYQSVIYLVRHPVAVMRSYHGYLNQHAGTRIEQEHMLTNTKFGVPAWKRHVNGWLKHLGQTNRLHVMRYEDLLQDAASTLGLLAGNIGWQFPSDVIVEAIKLSNATHMKESEELYRAHNPNYQLEFVHRNTPALDAVTCNEIKRLCRRELDMLGYRDE